MSEYKDYCDFETCMSLKELGYNGSSDFTYCKHCRVSDEIAEKHPGLSDSGYMDLIDEYDGPYKRNEVYKVYIEPIKTWSRNTMINGSLGELCTCVHLYDAQTWLRENKGIMLTVNIAYCYETEEIPFVMNPNMKPIIKGYYFGIWVLDDLNDTLGHSEYFKTYEEALANGIKKAINLLQEKK